MTALVHWLVTAFCAWECLRCFGNTRSRFPQLAIFAGLGLIHGLVPALTPRSMMWRYASDDSVLRAAWYALIGVIMFSVGWRVYDMRRPEWSGPSPGLKAFLGSPAGQRLLRRMFWIFGVISTIAWAVSLIIPAGSLAAAFSAYRFEYRFSGNIYLNVFVRHATNLTYVPGFVGFWLPARYRLMGVIYTVTMSALWFIGTQGARTAAIGLLGTLILGYTLRYKLTTRRLGLVTVLGTLAVLLAVGMYEIRQGWYRSSWGDIGRSLISWETYQDALTRDPLNYHQFLVAACEHFPRDHPYLNGATYGRILVFYLPQQYFAWLKPEDPHNTFAKVVLNDPSAWATIMPTMMGNGHINFWGLPGAVVVCFLNGVLFGFCVHRFRTNILWFLVIGAAYMRYTLMTLRGEAYEIVIAGLTSFSLAWLVMVLCRCPPRRLRQQISYVDRLAQQRYPLRGAPPRPSPGGAPAIPVPPCSA